MTEQVRLEIEGNTVQEAVKKALKELKLQRAQVKIEVLCEETKGLFGMASAKMAKIRVTAITRKEKS